MNSASIELLAMTGVFGLALAASLISGRTLSGRFSYLVERQSQPILYWVTVAVYASLFGLFFRFDFWVVGDAVCGTSNPTRSAAVSCLLRKL